MLVPESRQCQQRLPPSLAPTHPIKTHLTSLSLSLLLLLLLLHVDVVDRHNPYVHAGVGLTPVLGSSSPSDLARPAPQPPTPHHRHFSDISSVYGGGAEGEGGEDTRHSKQVQTLLRASSSSSTYKHTHTQPLSLSLSRHFESSFFVSLRQAHTHKKKKIITEHPKHWRARQQQTHRNRKRCLGGLATGKEPRRQRERGRDSLLV